MDWENGNLQGRKPQVALGLTTDMGCSQGSSSQKSPCFPIALATLVGRKSLKLIKNNLS